MKKINFKYICDVFFVFVIIILFVFLVSLFFTIELNNKERNKERCELKKLIEKEKEKSFRSYYEGFDDGAYIASFIYSYYYDFNVADDIVFVAGGVRSKIDCCPVENEDKLKEIIQEYLGKKENKK